MAGRIGSLVERWRLEKAQARWAKLAETAPEMDRITLKAWRTRARAMRREIDRLTHTANARLDNAVGQRAFPALPLGTEWSWRPDIWAGPVPLRWAAGGGARSELSADVELHHDCSLREVVVKQTRRDKSGAGICGLALDVYGFDGSFVSVTLVLPDAASEGLKPRHLVRLDLQLECERPMRAFARLNIKHGPNTEHLVSELKVGGLDQIVEFDLAYAKFDDKRVERAWLDLIFDRPAMNALNLRDATVSRRPRAEV